ncbi:MAG: hypothetical protein KGI37_07485 [Alphaproteobacteria bacterium]|nr:hypothetical protein [Alphaproteobacteria bacterium]
MMTITISDYVGGETGAASIPEIVETVRTIVDDSSLSNGAKFQLATIICDNAVSAHSNNVGALRVIDHVRGVVEQRCGTGLQTAMPA